MIPNDSILPIERLKQIAAEHKQYYQQASPCRHGFYDNVFDEKLLDYILAEFEEKDSQQWREFDTKYEKKLQLNKDEYFGPYTRAFFHSMNSAPFLHFLEELTGIKGLIADPYLEGGGLHKIPRGGKLGIHVDFNWHEKMQVYRRINVLVYLNKNWNESYGGHFQLWSDKNGSEKQKILPLFNRMAIFNTTNTSYHGHPEPLTCPENRARRSLALYYYTANDGGEQAKSQHSTIFVNEKGKREELGKKNLLNLIKSTIKKVIH